MPAMPRNDNRTFQGPLTVTCRACKHESTVGPGKRNDHKWPGAYCDGQYGARHALRLMLGPEGKAWA